MAAAVVGGTALGAALGASFADLHDTVRDVLYKAKNFEPILTRLKSTLDRLAPIMKYAKQFDFPEGEETWGLIEQMKMGENLVRNFLKIRWWKLYLKFLYRRRLEKLDNSIVRFCSLVDSQMVPTIGAQMWETVQTYFPDFKLKVQSICPGAATPSPFAPTPQPIVELLVSLGIDSQWQKEKLIGRGSFGSVYLATKWNTRVPCAIKEVRIFPDDERSALSIKQLWQEIKLLSELKHPNIVQYYDSEIVDSWLRIYLEYVPGGSIKKYIKDNGAIPESDIRRFTTHILSGLDYLHSKNIVHRDIKGANLLIDSSGVVRLADFGTAKCLALHADPTKLYFIGTAHWTAPELVQGLEPSNPYAILAVDIWSVGCTVLEMLTGRLPWGDLEPVAVIYRLGKGMTPPIPETLSPVGKEFLSLCLKINPADRPSAASLLEHPFVKNSEQLDGN
nr:mitogen-activated protein kinase kinase kinase 5-like [Quercus suber]POF25572.1 mitogen-activated protein kinase kinase kinase 5 [Quercus suber]